MANSYTQTTNTKRTIALGSHELLFWNNWSAQQLFLLKIIIIIIDRIYSGFRFQ